MVWREVRIFATSNNKAVIKKKIKKVILSFVVADDIAENVQKVLSYGEMGNAATTLNLNCEESDYDIIDVKEY